MTTDDATFSSEPPTYGLVADNPVHTDTPQESHPTISPNDDPHKPSEDVIDHNVSPSPPISSRPNANPPETTSEDDSAVPSLHRRPQESVINETDHPQVASLKAMFPDFDSTVLQSVLESVGGDQDRAVDMLLGMSDPDYISQEPAAPAPSQTDLDEQLARRLMLEEEQQQQATWRAQRPTRQGDTPYQPRAGGGRHSQHNSQQTAYNQQPAAGGRDTMAEFQDQFNKIAESGKKTFGTIFSKVKAKMQEFDQPRTGPGASSGTEPRWGSTGGSSMQGRPYEARAEQESYYDPNPQSYAQSYEPPPPQRRPVQGYDADINPPTQTYTQPTATGYTAAPTVPPSAPPATNVGSGYGTSAAAPPIPSPSPDIPRPPSTGAGAGTGAPNIDYSRLGLLPKRPVSLLRDQPPQGQTRPSDDDDDDLEYTENPFEEAHK